MKTLKEIKKEHAEFIDSIPENIKKLKNVLQKHEFLYDPEEVDEVHFFFEKYFNQLHKLDLNQREFENMIMAYFGTAWLWHFGGKWTLETSKSSIQYGRSCLIEYGGKNANNWISVSPLGWLILIKKNDFDESMGDFFRRKINFFKKRTEYILEPVRNIK